MKRKPFQKLFYAIVVSLAIVACNDVDLANISGDVEINEKLVMPIGYSSITARELVENIDSVNEISIDSANNDIYWSASDSATYEMKQVSPKEMKFEVDLPQVVVSQGITTPLFNINGVNVIFIDQISNTGERLDSAIINSLVADLSLSSTNSFSFSTLKLTITLDPSKAKHSDGSIVSSSVVFNSLTDVKRFSFNNFKVYDLQNPENHIGIPYSVSCEVTGSSTGTTIPANTKLVGNAAFPTGGFDYKIAYGYFKPSESMMNVTESFDFDLKNIGSLRFLNPQINIKVKSTVGVALSYDIDYIRSYKRNSTSVDTAYAEFAPGNTKNTTFFVRQATQIDKEEISSGDFNARNGATYKLFASDSMPNVIDYKYSVNVFNYDIPNPPIMWIAPSSKLTVVATARIPFYLDDSSYYVYHDSIAGIGDSIVNILKNIEDNNLFVNEGVLRLNVKNALPIHANMVLRFLDANGVEIPTGGLITVYNLDMPSVNATGEVTEATSQIIDIKLNYNQIENVLKKAQTLAYDLRLDGSSKDNLTKNRMNIKADNKFRLDLGLYLDAKYKNNFKK